MRIFRLFITLLLLVPKFAFSDQALNQLLDLKYTSFDIPQPQDFDKSSSQITGLPLYGFSKEGMISSYLKAAIDSSLYQLDIAMYTISDSHLAQAIIEAKQRGVKVRIIVDQAHIFAAKVDPSLKSLIDSKVEIRSLKGGGKYGIMHNKLAIFDSRIVFGGSFNWTLKANNSNFENAIFSNDSKYVFGYKKYFDWMWSYAKPYEQGPMNDYDVSNLKSIPSDNYPSVPFNSIKLPSYAFSPNGGIKETIIKAIDAASKEIKIAIFSFYDEEIYYALKRATLRGVKVKIVADRIQASQSDIVKNIFLDGWDFKWSSGFSGGVMHNKFLVLDSKLLISGSFNFSKNAQYYNFENVFITDKRTYTSAFEQEFDYIYWQARRPSQEEIDSINSFSPDSRLDSF